VEKKKYFDEQNADRRRYEKDKKKSRKRIRHDESWDEELALNLSLSPIAKKLRSK
jgi:hypothetical protein